MDWGARLAERRKNFSEGPDGELTKPTKRGFGSFVSKQDDRFENKQAREPDLFARCREACRSLPVSPTDLLAGLSEADKAAMRSGDPDELKALRAMAEIMAERERPELDAKIEKAYRECRRILAEDPQASRAMSNIDPNADPVLIAVAVRGIGCATLKVEKARYQGREFELLELVDRVSMAETATAGAAA